MCLLAAWAIHPKAAPIPSSDTTHALHSLSHDRQLGPGAGKGVTQPFENIEDSLLMLWSDADSIVFNPNARHVAIDFFSLHANLGLSIGVDELDGIIPGWRKPGSMFPGGLAR